MHRFRLPFVQRSVIAGLAGLLTGCSGMETVPPADGTDEYVFACAKDAGQPGCETQAREVCPEGFDTLSSEQDFDRTELRVRCTEKGVDAR
jgi:hypothetical protein